MRLRAALGVVGGVGLVVAPAACSGDGAAGGVRVTEVPLEFAEYDAVAGVVGWKDGFVAVTSKGTVLRSPDGERWVTVEATGLGAEGGEDRDDETLARTDVAAIAAGDGYLLAAGTRAVPTGDDEALFASLVWRSEDGERWEQLETKGLTAHYLDTLVTDGGGFLAFGTEEIPTPPGFETEEEREEGVDGGEGDAEEAAEEPDTIYVSSTWRSDDGEQWERIGENVLPPGENSTEDVAAVAVVGHEILASLGTECSGCYDDYSFVLSKSDGAGDSWRELDESGLDAMRLANTDVIPRVIGFEGSFVAVGTSEIGDATVATLWRSSDGERWTDETPLGGPRNFEYAESIDAVTATETGVVVLELRGDSLTVWRVQLS